MMLLRPNTVKIFLSRTGEGIDSIAFQDSSRKVIDEEETVSPHKLFRSAFGLQLQCESW